MPRCAAAAASSDDEAQALSDVRALLLDPARLLRAVASVSGSRPRPEPPAASRAELRPVRLKGELKLSVQQFVGTQAFTSNHAFGDDAAAAVDELLRQRFDNWRAETQQETLTLTRNRRGVLSTRRAPAPRIVAAETAQLAHDRVKARVLAPSSAVLLALGISTADGKVKAGKQDKYTQVEALCRTLDVAVSEALAAKRLPADRPLRLVDLGCGNAYLTFAAYELLAVRRGLACEFTGVDVKAQARERNTALAAQLGWSRSMRFVQGSIKEAARACEEAPDIVLALHACDTATDDALAAAVRWRAPLVLASPCCQHALQAQLKGGTAAHPHPMLTRHGLLRERLGDVLTDALRAHILSLLGYRVGVAEFVATEHTPRNVLLRADRTQPRPDAAAWRELDQLCAAWGLAPPLATALQAEMQAARASVCEAAAA